MAVAEAVEALTQMGDAHREVEVAEGPEMQIQKMGYTLEVEKARMEEAVGFDLTGLRVAPVTVS